MKFKEMRYNMNAYDKEVDALKKHIELREELQKKRVLIDNIQDLLDAHYMWENENVDLSHEEVEVGREDAFYSYFYKGCLVYAAEHKIGERPPPDFRKFDFTATDGDSGKVMLVKRLDSEGNVGVYVENVKYFKRNYREAKVCFTRYGPSLKRGDNGT